MVNIDALLSEWAYRCKKGYPDLDSPSDLKVLKTILKEQDITLPQLQEQIIVEQEEKEISIKDITDILNQIKDDQKALDKIYKFIINITKN